MPFKAITAQLILILPRQRVFPSGKPFRILILDKFWQREGYKVNAAREQIHILQRLAHLNHDTWHVIQNFFPLVIANDHSQGKKLFFTYVKKVKKINGSLSLIFKHKTSRSIRRDRVPPPFSLHGKRNGTIRNNCVFFLLSRITGTLFRSRKRGKKAKRPQ